MGVPSPLRQGATRPVGGCDRARPPQGAGRRRTALGAPPAHSAPGAHLRCTQAEHTHHICSFRGSVYSFSTAATTNTGVRSSTRTIRSGAAPPWRRRAVGHADRVWLGSRP